MSEIDSAPSILTRNEERDCVTARELPKHVYSFTLTLPGTKNPDGDSKVIQRVDVSANDTHVWLRSSHTQIDSTPAGDKILDFAPTHSRYPISKIKFKTRLGDTEKGESPLIAQAIWDEFGRIEVPIKESEIPRGTDRLDHKEKYRTMLRDGFFSEGTFVMAEEDKTFHKESKNGPRHRASEAFRKSQKPLRQLMKTATSGLSRRQAFNLKRDLAFVGTRGEGLTRPDKLYTRTAAMLLHVLKSNGHLSMGARPSIAQADTLVENFRRRYQETAGSVPTTTRGTTGESCVPPATRFAQALTRTADNLHKTCMTDKEHAKASRKYSALSQKALADYVESPFDRRNDLYDQLLRVYSHCRTNGPSRQLPESMHPKQLKGDWEWDEHHDAGEGMLAGITLTEEDYGKWPDESDHNLSKITLHPSDFENETRSRGVASQSSALSSGRSAEDVMGSEPGN